MENQLNLPEQPVNKSTERAIIFALWLLLFSASSQIIIIAPILPVIGEQLQMPEQYQGLLVTAYALMVAVFAIVIGPISDKIGRRKILLIGTGAMAISLSLHGAVQTWEQLVLVRAIAGVAGGLLSGSAVSYVADYFPYNRRGWANGWITSGIAAGQIFGIPIGTIMAEYFGFRVPFLIYGFSMWLTFWLVWAKVPQPDVQLNESRLTIKGALIGYMNLFRRADLLASLIAFSLMFVSVGLFLVYFPTWLQQTQGVSGNFIASLFLVGGIANVLIGPQAGRLSDKIGRKKLVIISCLGTSLLFGLVTVIITSPFWAYPFFFMIMMLVAMRISPYQTLMSEAVPGEQRGIFMSLNAAMGQAGMGIGGFLAGVLYSSYGYMSNTIVAAVAVLITGILIWRFVPESKYFRKKEEE